MIKHKFQSLEMFAKFDHHREETRKCPVCSGDVGHVGIDKVAYTCDVCTCRENGVTYDHVVEQLWHKACLVTYLTENPMKQTTYRYLPSQLTKHAPDGGTHSAKSGSSKRKKSSAKAVTSQLPQVM